MSTEWVMVITLIIQRGFGDPFPVVSEVDFVNEIHCEAAAVVWMNRVQRKVGNSVLFADASCFRR